MIFFFLGRPKALFMYQTSLTWVSLASEPDEQKNTFEVGTGDNLLEPFRELDRGVVALPGEEMAERELAHLRGRGLDQFFIAVAERRAPQPGHALDVGFAVAVIDEYALAALDDQRTGFAQCREIGVGVDQSLDIADGEVAERRHGFAFGSKR